ncbi:MAG TPA: MOSC N-terminal beta barrel domain-containing protein [Rhizomicrobium sp.]
MAGVEIGRVVELNRYPVKSMRGMHEDEVQLNWTGLAGDRQYAFVKSGDTTRVPWLTGRDFSELVLFQARYADPVKPRTSAVQVTAPDGAVFDIRSPELLRRVAGGAGCEGFLLQIGRGTFDSGPVSVIGTATLEQVSRAAGRPLEVARFRQNIVIEGARETEWLGGTLVFGDGDDAPRIHLNESINRCVMVTIDPLTAKRDPAVMRIVAERFDTKIGAYGAPVRTGVIKIGDPVRLIR